MEKLKTVVVTLLLYSKTSAYRTWVIKVPDMVSSLSIYCKLPYFQLERQDCLKEQWPIRYQKYTSLLSKASPNKSAG